MTKIRLAGGAVVAILIATSGPLVGRAQTQTHVDRDGVQYGGSLDPKQHGYEHAYRDGADRGRFDREHGVRYNANAKVYNDTTRGYEPFMGNKKQYQQGYREGYLAGYDSAYHGTAAHYGQIYGCTEENRNQTQHSPDPYATRGWGATDMAFDVGYRDGVTHGEYDRGRSVRSDYGDSDAYKKADHGYSSGYGARNTYQTRYRTGFERGYLDGYGRGR